MSLTPLDERIAPHLDELRAAARRLSDSPEDADDLLQECLAAAVAGLPRLRHPELAAAWLGQILRRKHIDAIRRRVRERRAQSALPPASRTEAADADLVRRALDRLDPEHRRVLQMRYFEQKSSVEIGTALRKPAGTVRSMIFYALRTFEAGSPARRDCCRPRMHGAPRRSASRTGRSLRRFSRRN